ncbi:MAG TPA: hypothetical protein VGX25_13470 [Actinophytocola sp.]|uniref:hypothetical protein n=1 Tax=Actinophytocola sp. TaxID=1872138 RepID=UPI002DDD531C|nr:hypothetical protein [Actinophytocola sp.]HEV2780393.1 hypothetical protein [Actinophytocola sp.]
MTISEHRPTIRRVVHPDVPGPLGPPPTPLQRLAHSIRIRHVNLHPVDLATYAIPAILSAPSSADLLAPTTLIAILTVLSGMHIVSMTTALAHRDTTDDPTLSDAVYDLRPRNIRRQIAITSTLVAGLATYLSAITTHWDILPLTLIMVCLGAHHATQPPHRPRLPILIATRFWLPMLLIARAAPYGPEWTILPAIACIGLCQTGILLARTRSTTIATVLAGLCGALASTATLAGW